MLMKQRLGVAVRLRAALENEVAGCLERDALLVVIAHTFIEWIARILLVDDLRHALKCLADLLFGNNAV